MFSCPDFWSIHSNPLIENLPITATSLQRPENSVRRCPFKSRGLTVLTLSCWNFTGWTWWNVTIEVLISIYWPALHVWVFIAQLVEHWSANAEDTGSNPFKARKSLFRATSQLLKLRVSKGFCVIRDSAEIERVIREYRENPAVIREFY